MQSDQVDEFKIRLSILVSQVLVTSLEFLVEKKHFDTQADKVPSNVGTANASKFGIIN